MDTFLLYIHPHGHLISDSIVPHGAFYTLNTVQHEKLGIFSSDIDDDTIRKAAVVLMDVHWPFAVASAKVITEHVKKIKPGVPVIVGGFVADTYPDMLLDVVPADYVVFNNVETSLRELVDCILEGKSVPDLQNVKRRGFPSGSPKFTTQEEFNELDFVTCSWFPGLFERGFRDEDTIEYHMILTRGCCGWLRSDGPKQCNIRRGHPVDEFVYRTPERLDRDLEALTAMFPNPERLYIYLYAGSIDPWLMDAYLDVIRKHEKITFWMYFCQTFSQKFLDLLEWKGQSVGVLVLLSCFIGNQPEKMMKLTPESLALLEKILHHGGYSMEELEGGESFPKPELPYVLTLELVPRPDEERVEVKCTKPINWKIPPADLDSLSDRELFYYMCEFGDTVNRLLPLQIFAPGIYDFYGFSKDPQLQTPDPLEWADDAFNDSIFKGLKKWGMVVPEAISYCAILARTKKRADGESGYFYAKANELEPVGGHAALDVSLELDAKGWVVSFGAHEPCACPTEELCAVILPRGLESAIEKHIDTQVMVFPISGANVDKPDWKFRFNIVNGRLHMQA